MAARTLGGIGLTGGYDLGEDGWKDSMDLNLLALTNLVQAGVIDAVAAVPGSPAAGDAYILTTAPHQYAIAVFDNAAWTYFTPLEGWWVYNRAANTFYSFEGGAWAPYTAVADIPGGTTGQVLVKASNTDNDFAWASLPAKLYRFGTFAVAAPAAGEILLLHVATDSFTIAANMVGCKVAIGANPTATFVVLVKKNGATIGTISISTAGVITMTTPGGAAETVDPGDVVAIVAPASADATIASLVITLRGVS